MFFVKNKLSVYRIRRLEDGFDKFHKMFRESKQINQESRKFNKRLKQVLTLS